MTVNRGPERGISAYSFKDVDVAEAQRWLDHQGISVYRRSGQTSEMRAMVFPEVTDSGLDWHIWVSSKKAIPRSFYTSWEALAFAERLFSQSEIQVQRHERHSAHLPPAYKRVGDFYCWSERNGPDDTPVDDECDEPT